MIIREKDFPMRDLETPTYICLEKEEKEQKWVDSEDEAKRNGGNLVSIQCREQNNLVNTLRGSNRVWIGFNDRDMEGKENFKWTGGEDVEFTNWYRENMANGEPNNHNGNEDCTEMWNEGSGGTWNDRNCDNELLAVYQTDSEIDDLQCELYYRKSFFLFIPKILEFSKNFFSFLF